MTYEYAFKQPGRYGEHIITNASTGDLEFSPFT